MQALTSKRLAASAYRTLGLSAGASQAQIEQAARRLRIWPAGNGVPPTAWDLPWLGSVSRSKIDIEQAFSRLNEPITRVEERLFWFHGADPAIWSCDSITSLDKRLRGLVSATDPLSLHDIALARLQLALLHDPQFQSADRWKEVLKGLSALSESDSYLAWSQNIERAGDFEKRARIEEIAAATRGLPDLVANSIAACAEAAMEDDDFPTATRILSVLRTSSPAVVARCEIRLAERLEDLIIRRCNHVHEDVDKIGSKTINNAKGQAICGAQARFYNESINPVLTHLRQVAGIESDRTHRARTEAARAMAHIGQCWAISGRLPVAEKTLAAALVLAEGTPVERSIRENLERCRRARRRKPPPQPPTPAPSVRNGQAFIPTYAVTKAKSKTGTTGSSGGWRGAGILVGILLAISRGITSFNSPSSSSTDTSLTAPHLYQHSWTPPNSLTLPPILSDQAPKPTLTVNGALSDYNVDNMTRVGDNEYTVHASEGLDSIGTAPQYAVVGKPFNIQLGTTTPTETIIYTLLSGPAGLKFNQVSGAGTWTPRRDQTGAITFKFAVANSEGTTILSFTFPCYAEAPAAGPRNQEGQAP